MPKKSFDKILIVDDNEDILLALKLLLKKHANLVILEKNPRKLPYLLNHDEYDLLLLDMNFTADISSGKEGFHWLEQVQEIKPELPVVMITAYGDVEMAVRALKMGATDFVLKPWDNKKLLETLKNIVGKSKESAKASAPTEKEAAFQHIIGESEAMQQVFTIIRKVAGTDANVLILGENGTGKEVVARALHEASSRKDEIFVSVDMGTLTETLFESELFGHKKGAFTDAKEDRAGRFEAANKGSLFLDEIGNLSLAMQAKLLTALQRREVIRVGTNTPIPVDIRLVCATNMPLHDMVREGTFRQDLLYRINTVELRLPPLRERGNDIERLAKHFVKIYAEKYNQSEKKLGKTALKKLCGYSWPGNIRELQHAIERAVIMSDEDELSPGDFLFLIEQQDAQDLELEDYNLENVERIIIQKAISKHEGNISKAAKALGLTRASLYRRLEKHGL